MILNMVRVMDVGRQAVDYFLWAVQRFFEREKIVLSS